MEKAVEINEKEIVTNELPKDVKTEKSNFWFIEQEIKTLASGLQTAKVMIHEELAGAVMGKGDNGDFFEKSSDTINYLQMTDCRKSVYQLTSKIKLLKLLYDAMIVQISIRHFVKVDFLSKQDEYTYISIL